MKNLETTENRLKRFNIPSERYDQEQEQLKNLGFVEEQIDRLIIRKYSRGNIEAIIECTPKLTTPPYHFTHQELTQIASHPGGRLNLSAVQDHFDAMTSLGFSSNQITRIVAHPGGSKNIVTVLEHFHALQTLGFNQEHITHIASISGGARNITSLLSAFPALQKLGFNIEELTRIASSRTGRQNIELIEAYYPLYIKAGYAHEKIVQIAAGHHGTAKLSDISQGLKASEALQEVDAHGFLTLLETIDESPTAITDEELHDFLINTFGSELETSALQNQSLFSSAGLKRKFEETHRSNLSPKP
jgi:Holliday junction resolvasome RuvABC DNA-binding subunit